MLTTRFHFLCNLHHIHINPTRRIFKPTSSSTSYIRRMSTPSTFTLSTSYPLQSKHSIPALGYGVYQTPSSVVEDVTSHAFKTGYRHVDSARAYRNEGGCAEAIRKSGLNRDQIFFTSKVPPKEMGYEKAKAAIEASFAETGLEYIDLYLIHAPYGGKEARLGSWRALAEFQKAGKIRSIGISNYGVHHLNELEEYIKTSDVGGIIDVGQWELHPWLPRHDIVDWCRQKGVILEAYSPLVRGERADEAVLKKLADKHGKTWAQVLVRWSLQKGFVPLPKSVTPKRIEDNADVYDFKLDADDMKELDLPDSYAPCCWDPTTSRD